MSNAQSEDKQPLSATDKARLFLAEAKQRQDELERKLQMNAARRQALIKEVRALEEQFQVFSLEKLKADVQVDTYLQLLQ